MKCDKLQQVENPIEWGLYYDKNEVDAAIDELKREHHKERHEYIEMVAQHKAKLVEQESDNRRMKRALWISRAKAYRYIAELIACFNPDYVRNRKMFTPNNLKQKQMNSLKWARLMLKIERKCRAKADEYK